MNRKMSIEVLNKCRIKIENMTDDEFENNKADLNAKEKVYLTDSYVTNLMQVILLERNL